jgi:hypothetical protein
MTSKEGPIKMAVQEDSSVRMAGYLDKRGKMVSSNFPVRRSGVLLGILEHTTEWQRKFLLFGTSTKEQRLRIVMDEL